MDKKNKIIIGSLCGVLLLMVVGYAAFSSLLNINGTSTISSNWEVKITNIVPTNVVGSASNASDPTYDDLSATFKTNLVSPGDSIEYDVTVSNSGNVNAKLDKITLTDSKNDAIKFSTSGLTGGDSLNAGDSVVLTVKVEYDESVTSQPSNLSSTLTVKLDYSQNTGNSGSGGSVSGGSRDTADMLIATSVTSGDGLYEDYDEVDRYIYRGGNPNNYIIFNDEVWRILSVESDGTLKIIRNKSIGKMNFDSVGYRTEGYCSVSNTSGYGCNAWAKMDNFVSGDFSGAVDKDASLNTYLNTTYYDGLNSDFKDLIVSHDFGVGPVKRSDSVSNVEVISQENKYLWNGRVALPTVSEYIKTSSSSDCGSLYDYWYLNNEICYTSSSEYNWLYKGASMWLVSPYVTDYGVYSIFMVGTVGYLGAFSQEYDLNDVFPVVYLNSDITLSGGGTSTNPYEIE